ncbi:exodeoxyribonuclease VII small subunit [Ahrensia marina]|uniref:exodeoxyribonuclease VII small subunit n=1 Tax=Ahrensia marina TaxID=1514904 RepID=UPI0035CF7F66
MSELDETAVDTLTFETAMTELERIVDRLERGEVALEDSIAIYERGEALKGRCEALLKAAEERVEKIRLSSSGEAAGTEPLDS